LWELPVGSPPGKARLTVKQKSKGPPLLAAFADV